MRRRSACAARGSGLVAAGIGVIAVAGWALDVDVLKSGLPAHTPMRLATAAATVLLGTSLWLQVPLEDGARRAIARVGAGLAGLLAALCLAWSALRPGPEGALFPLALADPLDAVVMAPSTAIALLAASAALVWLDGARLASRVSYALARATLALGFVALAGYVYGASALYGVIGHASMALNTSVALVAIAVGILCARPDRGGVAVLTQEGSVGATARAVLVTVVAVLVLGGAAQLAGQHQGLYGPEFGTALLVTIGVTLITALIINSARTQALAESARNAAADAERFVMEVGDLLRTATASSDVLKAVAARLGDRLGVTHCVVADIDAAAGPAMPHEGHHAGVSPLADRVPFASLGADGRAELQHGRVVCYEDTEVDPRTASRFASWYQPASIRSAVLLPLLRDGCFVALLVVADRRPRRWTVSELALIAKVAERTWVWVEHLRGVEVIRESEARKAALLRSAFDAIVLMDRGGAIVEFNPAAERLFGHPRAHVLGRTLAQVIVPESLRAAHEEGLARYLATGAENVLGRVRETEGLRADGRRIPIELAVTRIAGLEPPMFAGFVRDVSERKRADERFRIALEAAPTGMALLSPDGRIELVNRELERIFGYPREELVGQSVDLLSPAALRDEHRQTRDAMLSQGAPRRTSGGERAGVRKDGTEVPIDVGWTCVDSANGAFILKSVVDITDRKRADAEQARLVAELKALSNDLERRVEVRTHDLAASLREKEVLLKEVHHRVKNNLQVIASLLNLQAQHLQEPRVRAMLDESRDRVYAIAAVHEKLYRSRDLSRVPFGTYAREVVDSLIHGQGAEGRVSAIIDVRDGDLTVDLAVPCGLILSELVTNALKHGFPDGRTGTLRVSLAPCDAERVELVVSDDGIGLPASLDPHNTASLGLDLVMSFGEQIHAEITIRRAPGTAFSFKFRRDGRR